MTEWREVTLGEVCELKRGYDLPKADRHDGTVPIVSSSGISGFHSEAKVRAPGVVTGRYGTLGQVFYVAEDFWPLNTALYVRDFKGNVPRFVAALLEFMNLSQHDGAAAVPGLNRNQLHGLTVRIPDTETQSPIAEILRVLGDLVENIKRRVAILEELIGSLYREWFVKFRYPGHEHSALVDSPMGRVPAGWRQAEWGAVAILDYGKALRGYKGALGEYPVFGTNGPIGWCREARFPPGVIVGRKGAYRGIHYSASPCWVIDTAFYLRILEPENVDPLFAFHQLRTVNLNAIDSGSAIPSTSRDAFYSIPLVVPPADLMARFAGTAKAIMDLQVDLDRSARALVGVRDLILPRLVTGQVDVSSIDLDALLEGWFE